MPTIDQFVKDWMIHSDSEFFADKGTLEIRFSDKEKTKCDVRWPDMPGQSWFITNLPFSNGVLESHPIDVRSVRESCQRHVLLELLPDTRFLKGTFTRLYGEGPVGTFTAEANNVEEGV